MHPRRLLAALGFLCGWGAGDVAFGCRGIVPIPCAPAMCESIRQHFAHVEAGRPETFSSHRVSLLSQVPLSSMGGVSGTRGSSLFGWVDPLTRREYAIMGRSNGTAFIDITNPVAPVYVAELPKAPGSSDTLWREPKVYRNHAYIGVDGTNHPIQVVDLLQLRAYSGTTLNLASTTYSGTGSVSINRVHTLAVNPDSGFLYAAGTNRHGGGLHIVDVRNPSAPVYAGGWAGDGYTHETQVVVYQGPDIEHRGKEIAFSSNGKFDATDTVSIIDLSNKAAPVRLSAAGYPNVGYIHQGWLTEDQRYFFQNDEFDETDGVTGGRTRTHLWDVSDLDSPVYRGFFDHETTSVDHNLYVKGKYLYQTNYTTGLRIFEMGDLSSSDSSTWLKEVAWFDAFPENDAPTYNGAWNNYPYFPSGNIVISDLDRGLFVVRPNLPLDQPLPRPIYPWAPTLLPEPCAGPVTLLAAVVSLRRRKNLVDSRRCRGEHGSA
jgi:choice-of-anchor B domain-containing protein